MKTIFVMVKCELAQAYRVADDLMLNVEEVSEIHSISGQYDLIVKCYLPADTDIGHFVTKKRGNIINVSSTAGSRGFAGGTAYVASKFALGGMTECWRAELRKHDIRVMQINPSEVLTNFSAAAGYDQKPSEKKLRSEEIAHAITAMLAMDDRGFTTELTVFATNPE